MLTDVLRGQLHEIESFCAENAIPLFYGAPFEVKTIDEVYWDDAQLSQWQKYLMVAKSIGPKIVHLDVTLNESPDEEEREEMARFKNTLSPDALVAFEESSKIVQQTTGFVSSITLTFYEEKVSYILSWSADWENHYNNLSPYTSSLIEQDDTLNEQEIEKQEAELEARLDEEAQKMLLRKDYLAASTENERRNVILRALLQQYENREHLFAIARKAEILYKAQVQSKIDEEITEKLNALRKANPKLSKAAAAGLLKMSDRQIGRYWYSS